MPVRIEGRGPAQLRKNAKSKLVEMARAGGYCTGVAAAVQGATADCQGILRGTDKPAQEMLLSCARLIRTALPVEDVARLMKEGDASLSLAAERYLESEDGPQARQFVLARHPGEVRILGARMAFDPGHVTFGAFGETEERLRKELLRPDGPDQIIALLTEGYWGNEGQRIIRIKGKTRTLYYERGNGKCLSHTLTEAEFTRLMELISTNRVDDLPPLNTNACDGLQVEYVRISREGGRRVFMNNPTTSEL